MNESTTTRIPPVTDLSRFRSQFAFDLWVAHNRYDVIELDTLDGEALPFVLRVVCIDHLHTGVEIIGLYAVAHYGDAVCRLPLEVFDEARIRDVVGPELRFNALLAEEDRAYEEMRDRNLEQEWEAHQAEEDSQ